MEHKLDNRQRQMLDFETSWYPLGGGSSHAIAERFGLSDRDFFREVDRIIETDPPSSMRPDEIRHMRGVIRRRIWMAR